MRGKYENKKTQACIIDKYVERKTKRIKLIN